MASELTRPAFILWWGVTLAWAALIFYLSTRTFSPTFSSGLLSWMLHFLHLQVSTGTFELLHTLLRKLAHLTEYAIFALLLYGSPHEKRLGHWEPRRAAICIAMAAAYSLTDEFHQWFVPGRHASLGDCGLDTIGATLAMVVPYAWNQVSLRRSTASSPRVRIL